MAAQLDLYNIALAAVGERTLDSTSENRAARRELDKVWNRDNGARHYGLEQGLWTFATTRAALDSSSTAAFGFNNAAALPSDFIRLAQISTSVDMENSIYRYEIEGRTILSESTTVYIRYVSNSTSFGYELLNWSDTFSLWMGHWMATQIYPTLKAPTVPLDELEKRTEHLLVKARLQNVTQESEPFPDRTAVTILARELDHALELARSIATEERR